MVQREKKWMFFDEPEKKMDVFTIQKQNGCFWRKKMDVFEKHPFFSVRKTMIFW